MANVTRFRTASGSLYEIDYDARRWRRISHPAESNALRSSDGEFLHVSRVAIGSPVMFICPPFAPGFDARTIETTRVTEIVPA